MNGWIKERKSITLGFRDGLDACEWQATAGFEGAEIWHLSLKI